jgi:enoyl-CoA hydratase
MVSELAFTGRRVGGAEAVRLGLANRAFPNRDALLAGVGDIAQSIAAKSPLAIRGTKEMLRYSRDHSVADGLNYIATWNAAMLISADLTEALQAAQQKRPPVFGH